MIQVINPATGEHLRTYNTMKTDQVNSLIDDMHATWLDWRQTSFEERASHMKELARLLRAEKEQLARLMTEEMGKVYKQGVSEAEKCAWVCDYFAENAEAFLAPTPIDTEFTESYIAYQPLGIVLAIMPWNFPFWQVMRFAAPSLMAGNVGVLKHAPNVPGCAAAIEDLFERAGFPKNVFRNIPVEVDEVENIIANPKVKAVTLTGSTRAGKSVAALAGKYLKKTVLELGGSDPYVILPDADVDEAAKLCVTSRLINNGQSCIAAKRFIVVKEIADEFTKKVVALMKETKMGDPDKDDVDLGPIARKDLLEQLHKQVEDSLKKGAKALVGGKLPDQKGFFYPATVLTDIPHDAPAFHEELFGPVASIIVVENAAEALQVANDTNYGLGAAIFTTDIEKGKEMAEKHLDAGCCFVNDFVKSDPRLPFGGIKESGYGRELSMLGIKEFVNQKTVAIK